MPSQNHRPDHPHNATARVTNPSPLGKLYETLADLRTQIEGPYTLEECHGRANWPEFGLYFFFTHDSDFTEGADPTEDWSLSRIGTVGVRNGTRNPLWQRLRQHRGNKNGKYELGGNHRGSVYRKHVGRAFIEKEDLSEQYPEWGYQTSTPPNFENKNTH